MCSSAARATAVATTSIKAWCSTTCAGIGGGATTTLGFGVKLEPTLGAARSARGRCSISTSSNRTSTSDACCHELVLALGLNCLEVEAGPADLSQVAATFNINILEVSSFCSCSSALSCPRRSSARSCSACSICSLSSSAVQMAVPSPSAIRFRPA